MKESSSAVRLLALAAAGAFSATCAANATDTADYVIVGGGPAGVVLAERLSRDGTKHIILLEAGQETFDPTLLNSTFLSPYHSNDFRAKFIQHPPISPSSPSPYGITPPSPTPTWLVT